MKRTTVGAVLRGIDHPIAQGALEVLARPGFAFALELEVVWNTRLRTAAGRIRWTRPQDAEELAPPVISLHPRLEVLDGPRELLETLLHEVAHAIAGRAAGHGPRWAACCHALGIAAERTHAAHELLSELPRRAVCDGCGFELRRPRPVPVVNRRGQRVTYVCRACGGRLVPVEELEAARTSAAIARSLSSE